MFLIVNIYGIVSLANVTEGHHQFRINWRGKLKNLLSLILLY